MSPLFLNRVSKKEKPFTDLLLRTGPFLLAILLPLKLILKQKMLLYAVLNVKLFIDFIQILIIIDYNSSSKTYLLKTF